MKAIADAGLIVALFNRNDPAHGWARRTFETLPPPLFTCEPAVMEAFFRLEHDSRVVDMVRDGDLLLDFRLQEHASRVRELLRKYADREMDLADACLVCMAEIDRDCCIYTVDRRDFAVYRRYRNDPVPCEFPAVA